MSDKQLRLTKATHEFQVKVVILLLLLKICTFKVISLIPYLEQILWGNKTLLKKDVGSKNVVGPKIIEFERICGQKNGQKRLMINLKAKDNICSKYALIYKNQV